MTAVTEHQLKKSITLYGALLIVILILGGLFAAIKIFELQKSRSEIRKFETMVAMHEEALTEIAADQKKLEGTFTETETLIKKHLADTFPAQEKYTDLTRTLDTFFLGKNRAENPIVASDLRFGVMAAAEHAPYGVLPLSLTLASSETNFFAFLDFVQKSGTLGSGIRLMDIQSIKINFRDDGSKRTGEEINANIDLRAYVDTSQPSWKQ